MRNGYLPVGHDLIPSPDSVAFGAPTLDAWMGKACMYCRCVYEAIPCAERERHGLTHGICDAPECRSRYAAQLKEARRGE